MRFELTTPTLATCPEWFCLSFPAFSYPFRVAPRPLRSRKSITRKIVPLVSGPFRSGGSNMVANLTRTRGDETKLGSEFESGHAV